STCSVAMPPSNSVLATIACASSTQTTALGPCCARLAVMVAPPATTVSLPWGARYGRPAPQGRADRLRSTLPCDLRRWGRRGPRSPSMALPNPWPVLDAQLVTMPREIPLDPSAAASAGVRRAPPSTAERLQLFE